MKVSMKSRYALRLMLALALHEEENLSVKTVAAMQGISEKYLEQVIPVLVRDGFVNPTAISTANPSTAQKNRYP